MLRLHFAGPEPRLVPPSITFVGATLSVTATIDALRSTKIDAMLFPSDWSHPMRSVRAALSTEAVPPFIAVNHHASRASMAHALACGFDGVVGANDDAPAMLERIERIIDGTWTFESEPWLRELGVTRGLLARELILDEDTDDQIVDLVSTGLPDDDIAVLMDWTIQRVRNRIEALLSANDLSYRTQLAVIRAASLKVPDFS